MNAPPTMSRLVSPLMTENTLPHDMLDAKRWYGTIGTSARRNASQPGRRPLASVVPNVNTGRNQATT